MKRVLFLLFGFVILGPVTSIGQNISLIPFDDSTGRRIDLILLELNTDYYQELPPGVNQDNVSISVNAYLMKDFRFGLSKWSVGVGLGIGSHGVRTDGAFLETDINGSSFTALVPITDTSVTGMVDIKVNKLNLNYIDIPLEIRFITLGRRPFRIVGGFKVGVLVNSKVKFVNDQIKFKNYTIKNLNSFRWGVTAKIGWSKFAVVGYYGLSPVFNYGKGTELKIWSAGFSFIFP